MAFGLVTIQRLTTCAPSESDPVNVSITFFRTPTALFSEEWGDWTLRERGDAAL